MTRNLFICLLFCLLLLTSCATNSKAALYQSADFPVGVDTLKWFDASRQRTIPIAFYTPKTSKKIDRQKLVIFSHGYNQNRPGSYLAYSYLANKLASKGYLVVSIQHELPTDSIMPLTGIAQIVRHTNWERGVANILFTLNELKKTRPNLDYDHLILAGHSNGGDMSMLFAQKYPGLVYKVISLDNRRVALPKTKLPKIYSIRSSDQPADEGVLPTAAEQKTFGMQIVKLPHTIHNDMGDNGNEKQHKEINDYIAAFLSND